MLIPAGGVRLAATVLLAVSVLLPSYTCAGYIAPGGEKVTQIPSGADSSRYQPTKIPHYPLENPDPLDGTFWLMLFAYGWPVPLIWLRRRPHRGAVTAAVVLEPLLAILSGLLIYRAAMVGDLAIGTYLALAADGVLLLVGAHAIRAHFRRPIPSLASHPNPT